MPIVDFKSSLMLSDVIATELSELPIVWEMWNIVINSKESSTLNEKLGVFWYWKQWYKYG